MKLQKLYEVLKTRIFLCFGIGLVGLGCLSEPVSAQAYSNFPYASDFGTAAAPGKDNGLYQFTSEELNGQGGGLNWAFEESDDALYPTYTELDSWQETKSTFVTRPFYFSEGFTYRLTVVYEASEMFDDAEFFWRLAPENSSGDYGISFSTDENDPLYPDNKLIVLNESGVGQGETSEFYEISPSKTGNYVLTLAFYPKDGIFPDQGRKLRIKSIEVSQKSPYDLAMGKIVTPVSHYSTAPQTVSAWVRNEGTAAVTEFSLCYTVGSQTVVKQSFIQDIPVGGEVLVSFNEPAVLSSGSNRIRVFLTDRPSGDPLENDTAAPVFAAIYDAPYQPPFTFAFGNNTLNQRWTALYDAHTDETTWRFGTQNEKACAYIETSNTDNNARLAGPGIRLSGGQTYRFRFHYTGLSTAAEKLSAYMADADFTDESRMKGYWKDEGFSNSHERVATFFYTAAADGVYHLVLKAHSDNISGGIAVWNLEVDPYEPTRGDFYYEFDPMGVDMTASALLASSAYFMDKNHNGQAWQLTNAPVYNGEAAAKGGEAFMSSSGGHTTDDWMVFNPLYLEGGKTYTLSYMSRAGGNNHNVILESMICREAFAFGGASEIVQTDKNEINTAVYTQARYTFTPAESGNYQLAFRYNTYISKDVDLEVDNFSVYLDHVGLFEVERRDLELAYVDIPVGAQMGQRNVYIKCGYRNFGDAISAARLKFYYRIGGQAVVSESAVQTVAAGGIGRHNFNKAADFSRDTLNEVRIWAQDGDAVITDTFKLTVRSLKSHYPPYRDLLTEETKDEWRISSLAAEPSWQFVKDGAYEAPYAARTLASDGVLDDYLVLPPIQCQKDTVYMLAFYAKSSQDRLDPAQTGLSLVYSTKGYGVADFDRNIGRVDALTTEYESYRFHFKAQESGPAFVAFHSQLPAYGGSNWIDHVVVLDSVSASYSYMALTDIAYRRVTGCDEDRTTEVELEIRNDGYLAYDSVPILYKMDDLPVRTYWLENGLADLSERRFTLPDRWDLSVAGNHRIKVWIGMSHEFDRSDDTLTVLFRADDMAQLPLGYDFENNVLPGNVEDRNGDRIGWELRRNADSAYAGRYYVRYQGTGQAADDDWKLPCFYAEAGEYTLDFYMSAPYASEELLEVYLLHYDETDAGGDMVRELLSDAVVSHPDYQLYQLPFKVQTGHYGVMFRIKSEADGRTLCIDNLTVAGYGLKDVALSAIVSPAEADTYNDPLAVTVRLRNNGRVTIHDVPLVLTINGEEVQREEVPTMEGNTEMDYTFPNPIDLHVPGTYRIAVSAEWVLDQRPGNNRQEITRVQADELDLALTVLTSPMAGRKPYGKEETLAVRIENRGRTSASDVPIETVVNGTRHLNGILPKIDAGEAIVYTFDQTVDMSDSAWYVFVICLSPATPDNNPLNDTLYSRIDGRYEKTANENVSPADGRLVYPNPAHDVLYVEVPNGFTHLAIYSMRGVHCLSRTVAAGLRCGIPVADFPEGLYVLRLSGTAGEKTIKWIKTR